MDWIRHALPSHRSASVPDDPDPTAVHADAELHATLLRPLSAPAGLGVGATRQLVPFHCSASGTCVPALVVDIPTARQADDDVHATPARVAPVVPAGLGVGWTCQTVPSHRSANVPSELEPTTSHPAADVHATPFSLTPVAPAGLGVDSIRHARPSQRSASRTRPPDDVVEPPTATHDEALEHESAVRKPVRTTPFGLDTIDQPAADALAPPASDPTTDAAHTRAKTFRTHTLRSLHAVRTEPTTGPDTMQPMPQSTSNEPLARRHVQRDRPLGPRRGHLAARPSGARGAGTPRTRRRTGRPGRPPRAG